jgi:cytosine/creatinine deaminase
VLGAAPYTDSDPRGQIDHIFTLARDHGVDIDMHLDLGDSPEGMDIDYVCDLTERYRYGGRVAVGYVTRLSTAPVSRFEAVARRLGDVGVAVTVLPSTDLYLCGLWDLTPGDNCPVNSNRAATFIGRRRPRPWHG